MYEKLISLTALPNLHPALVHFPVALLVAALGFDLAFLILRRQVWLDRAAAALYVLGAMGTGAAYWAGRMAADSVQGVQPSAQLLISEHADWAYLTLLTFSGLALFRTAITWRDRKRSQVPVQPVRLLLLVGAVLGQWLLFQTADRGGALVYRYGVAVAVVRTEPSQSEERHTTQLHESGAEPRARLVKAENGTLTWTPLPGEVGALGGLLKPLGESPEEAVTPAASGAERGLPLRVSGRALLVLPQTFDDVQVEARLDLTGFAGTAGVAHHVQGPQTAGLFLVSTDGMAELVHETPTGRKVLDKTLLELPRAAVTLAVSAAGSHLKGLLNENTVVHGHMRPSEPGAAGIIFDGSGVVIVLSLRVTPLGRQ